MSEQYTSATKILIDKIKISSRTETLLHLVGHKATWSKSAELSPSTKVWAERIAKMSQLDPVVLNSRLKMLGLIIAISLILAVTTILTLVFGLSISDNARFVSLSVLMLSTVLIVGASLTISHLLWSAYVFERILHGIAIDCLYEMRDLTISLIPDNGFVSDGPCCEL